MYAEIARQYTQDVLDGTIPACLHVRNACQRAVDDHARDDGSWGFTFSEKAAHRVCSFVERMPHLKGELAGTKIRLEPWQIFVLVESFGWLVLGGKRDGKRRFRTAYIEIPRGNGKSSLLSGVMLYMLCADGEQGAEVYSAATTRQQAGIVFGDAQAMARSVVTRPLMTHLGVEVTARSITVKKSNSKFIALSADGHSLDGLSIHGCAADELHAHKTRTVWDVLVTGAGKRPQSFIWAITTAGFDLAGIAFEVRDYSLKVLQNVVIDETMFACIYTIDEGDSWQDPAIWQKANPNWNVSVEPDHFAARVREAIALPSKQANLLTKHFDVWVSNANAWADMAAWKSCMDLALCIDDYKGRRCFIGLDLASKTDMAAKVLLFPERRDGVTHYTVFATHYLPEDAVTDGRNSQYRGWEIEGRIKTTEGGVLDFSVIRDDILADMATYEVIELAIDPYEARQLVQQLQAQGCPVVEVPQTVAALSESTKECDALTRSGRFHFNDPVMLWHASNVIVITDTNDNVKPRKLRPENKIDSIIATICALTRALVEEEHSGSLIHLI